MIVYIERCIQRNHLGEHVGAFMNLLGTTYKPGALDTKTEELISAGIGAYNRCEYCIVSHVYKAFEAGATSEQIMEAAMVSVAFGGGPPDPEIAMVGIGEKAAKNQGIEVEVGRFSFSANGKVKCYGETNGFIKIIRDKKTGKLIGASIVGLHATELIAELTLAIKNNLSAEAITETIHSHPTTAEVIHEAFRWRSHLFWINVITSIIKNIEKI
ncbi:carboxymuconolactone decarboxylase family protein [Clostridium sp.]|jgi:AhpD family alkylhydroperoxidase|uniref:carboxymuconolactone decarboxylase family protein n=1 Tax=Clostridium sp. TaxID=1506 RepID=UPI003EED7AB4